MLRPDPLSSHTSGVHWTRANIIAAIIPPVSDFVANPEDGAAWEMSKHMMNSWMDRWFLPYLFALLAMSPMGCGDSQNSFEEDSDETNSDIEGLDTESNAALDTETSDETSSEDADSENTDRTDTSTQSTDEIDASDEEDTEDGTVDSDITEPQYSGTPHFELEIIKESNWNLDTVKDTLSRRILGLRWTIKGKGILSKQFEIWPESDNRVSDARMYQLSEMFKKDPWVVSVKPVYVNPNFVPPKDDTGRLPIDDPVWYLGSRGINAYEAWKMFAAKGKRPGEGVLIGLPDTGYLDHPELFNDDGSTQLRLDLQHNFAEKSNPDDAHDFCGTLCGITVNKTIKLAYVGHGSTTASLMISPPGKQKGTVGHLYTEGAAQYAEVIPIRVSASVLMTPTAIGNLAKGVRYATAQGAQVISISMGGFSIGDSSLKEAIVEATDKGVIVVAAAGNAPYNSGAEVLSDVSVPASYEETIAVCGSNAYGEPWRDTSRGPEADICAPAEDIRRARAGWVNLTKHVNDTDRSEGTSMSAALTASVAALWISYHGYDTLLAHYGNEPAKIPEAFRFILHHHGYRRPNGWDTDLFGAGIIDAARVLQAPLPSL